MCTYLRCSLSLMIYSVGINILNNDMKTRWLMFVMHRLNDLGLDLESAIMAACKIHQLLLSGHL